MVIADDAHRPKVRIFRQKDRILREWYEFSCLAVEMDTVLVTYRRTDRPIELPLSLFCKLLLYNIIETYRK